MSNTTMANTTTNLPALLPITAQVTQGVDTSETEVINRVARKCLEPYNPIRRVQGLAGASRLHFAVEMQDTAGVFHLVSSPGRLLSPSYNLLENREVAYLQGLIADMIGGPWIEKRIFFDGARFDRYLTSPKYSVELRRNDIHELGLRAVNSYDGSRRAAIEVFSYRLVCSNGALMREIVWSHTFSHRPSAENNVEEIYKLEAAVKKIPKQFSKVLSYVDALHDMRADKAFLRKWTNRLPSGFPSSAYGDILRHFYTKEDETLFGLYQAATAVTWHRGDTMTQADLMRNETLVADLIGFEGIPQL